MADLWKLAHYNEVAILTLGRAYKALLLPMLKDIIRSRLSSKGDVDLILKEKHHDDMLPNSQHKFSLGGCNDFRLVLKFVSQNKIDCFSDKEADLCFELREYGNKFAHETEFERSFVSQVLFLTRELLYEIGKRNHIDECLRMLEDIEDFLKSNF